MKISEEGHPDLEQIMRFVRGEASPAENRELVRHLLHGCSGCQKVVREYWSEEAATEAGSSGARPISHAAERETSRRILWNLQ